MTGRRTYDELVSRRHARRMLEARINQRKAPPIDWIKTLGWAAMVLLSLALWTACLHIMGVII